MERKLDTLNRPKLTDPQRLALHRAFHTAALELADRADDSGGVIGEMRSQAWRYYLELDWACCGMQPEDYWADLCSLVVTEQYGPGHREQALPWTRVPPTHAGVPRRRPPVVAGEPVPVRPPDLRRGGGPAAASLARGGYP